MALLFDTIQKAKKLKLLKGENWLRAGLKYVAFKSLKNVVKNHNLSVPILSLKRQCKIVDPVK